MKTWNPTDKMSRVKLRQIIGDGEPPETTIRAAARKIRDRAVAAIFALLGYEPATKPGDRIILPMSSGISVKPNTSAQITSRPQACSFRPSRIVIGGTPGSWIVNDILICNRSQLAQCGDVPGEVFSSAATDAMFALENVPMGGDFTMIVTYVGPGDTGERFTCAIIGAAEAS